MPFDNIVIEIDRLDLFEIVDLIEYTFTLTFGRITPRMVWMTVSPSMIVSPVS